MKTTKESILDPKYFEGSELAKLEINFHLHELVLNIHWWKDAKEDLENSYPGYSRPESIKEINYIFYDVENLKLNALTCSNAYQIIRIDNGGYSWEITLVDDTSIEFTAYDYEYKEKEI